jgi:isopentenyl diphosphate isomerase/L-lactate dehydrogenase-like FMN-dependent dehydrogenase
MSRKLNGCVTIDDLRSAARRQLPRAVFDFIDGAAEDESTLRLNRAAYGKWTFSPRVLVDVGQIDLTTTVLGQPLQSPLILAPAGLSGMAAPRPEVLAARAAKRTGVIFTASCLSAVTMEDIVREGGGRNWFQLYLWRDRELTKSLVQRAARAGYSALVVTVDVPVLGQRERDARNGATIPPKVTLRNAWDSLRRPGWLLSLLRNPPFEFANIAGGQASARRPFALSKFINSQFDPTIAWSDLEWIRDLWPGPLALKGIMSTEDAVRAADHGVDAIVVSNHGGRQLDGLPPSLTVLPEIVDAVGSRLEVIFDGGIRRGTDAIKALALGARACMIGRAYLYGLGAGGEEGAVRSIEILQTEMARAMALLGRPNLRQLDRSALRHDDQSSHLRNAVVV